MVQDPTRVGHFRQRVGAGALVPEAVVTPEPELVAEVAAAKPR